ncbi:hypothetical protein CDL15_Pgr003768 [Punica granatum]|uniref:RING-type domain-containing protein n=1 Tax=Punica granatum TaxID=22663 RepID=A0A218XUM9_PUNGR|nr:hypothetical protein CDL15_Pgr003768 [Punica granatum]
MEGRRYGNGPISSSPEVASSATRSLQPNYSSRAVREAFEHLASIEPIELCNEAKIERCRAARDLRNCARNVQNVLNSCGHASLCDECSQRCDLCPICRVPIPKDGHRLRRRLYSECVEAGLISKRCDERFREVEDGENHADDVQRLYSFFDVALENNLVSLICHYITDVCMDESAVSSDPVTAFLLDEVVVKDWCKRTFQNILIELQGIYKLDLKAMKSKLNLLLKHSGQLNGISNVLEVLDSSFRDALSPQLHDLHQLHECLLKTKQHIEAVMWCIRHEFLENVRSRYNSYASWSSLVRERRSAAIKRAWPDAVNQSAETNRQDGSLFIEDALRNIDIDGGQTLEMEDGLDLLPLKRDGHSSILASTLAGVSGCYPFENLRAAVDVLFLYGSSDLVVAKRAILLYYLYDRHWTLPDEEWRDIIDDFAASFRINRHSLLESLIFYLLDDHTVEALEEASRLLPEISSPSIHPKIPQVLLERQMPDIALMVLRWSGHDNGVQLLSLSEAVTAIRVRVECGLLTEAFTHQRMLYAKVREKKLRHVPCADPSEDVKGECRTWVEWMEILVTEMCCLCIRRKLVDRMIELPWNSDEEKYIHKCLLDYARDDPSTIIGSLLVVFYLQRYRYFEAYKVDRELQRGEEDFKSNTDVSEEVLSRMQAASKWRATLIDKGLELLPQVQQQQIKSGKFPETGISSATQAEVPEISSQEQMLNHTSCMIPSSSSTDAPLILGKASTGLLSDSLAFEAPGKSNLPSVSREWSFTNAVRGLKPEVGIAKSFKYDEISTPGTNYTRGALPLHRITRSPSTFLQNSHQRESSPNHKSPELEQNGFLNQFHRTSPLYPQKTSTTGNPLTTPRSNRQMLGNSTFQLHKNISGKRVHSDTNSKPWDVDSLEDPMDVSWSGVKAFAVEDPNLPAAPRWRSDETSDEEEGAFLERSARGAPYATPAVRGVRRSRFMIR